MTRRRWVLIAVTAALVSGPATAVFATSPASSRPAATSAGTVTCATDGTWSMYQAGPTHTGNACSQINSSNVDELLPAWFTYTVGTVTATPAVVDGSVYDGDSTGLFYALKESSGVKEWTFNAVAAHTCFVDVSGAHVDQHQAGMGEITSSPAVATIAGTRMIFVGAGASLFALNAATGACMWAQDTDPLQPKSQLEMESSPVVDMSLNPPEVLVGNDDNSSGGIAVTGLMAFDAQTGGLLWKFEPERDLTLRSSQFGGSDALTMSCGDGVADTKYCNSTNIPDLPPNSPTYADGCGDVWSSPALDASFVDPGGTNSFQGSGGKAPSGWYAKQITASGVTNPSSRPDGLVMFGTGNCGAVPDPATALSHGDYADNQGIYAVDPVTGVRVWSFIEPYNLYDNNPKEPWDGDDDFGSSAVLASVPAGSVPAASCTSTGAATNLVIEGGKDGYAYGLCERTGARVWENQVSQAGNEGAPLGGIGGFLGSPALGAIGAKPVVYMTSAIPIPFANEGIREPPNGDHNIAHCPGPVLDELPLLPACPDLTLLKDPLRLLSMHAVSAATGQVIWRAVSVPTYAAATYTNGVVFDPETTAFGVVAYSAVSGLPLWAFPLAASPASAIAIVDHSIFMGAGTADETVDGINLPPQLDGIWSFSTSAAVPEIHL